MKITIFITILMINTVLFAGEPIFVDNLTEADNLSYQKNIPVLLIFGHQSCGYCLKLKKDINTGVMDSFLEDKIVCYIDLSKDKDLSKEYNIREVPDSRIYHKKRIISKIVGYNKEKYKEWLYKNK